MSIEIYKTKNKRKVKMTYIEKMEESKRLKKLNKTKWKN